VPDPRAKTTTDARAIAFHRRRHEVICDVVEPWEHGTAVRCTAHPGFWDYNCLRLEGPDPGVSASELAAIADRRQHDLAHRRFDVEDEATGARLRPGFEALGWTASRLVWLALTEPPAGPDFDEVPYEATRALRLDWARADGFAGSEREYQRQAIAEEDVARRRGTRALMAGEDAYVTFVRDGDAAEVEQAYVTPALRGRGTGGALVAAAARACDAAETFIVADDEGDPKRLYERLGFRPAWIQYEFTRRPSATLA
jgi:GNAT superfamily N-acetyltransferase